jgi:outer membrane protein TolC
VRRHTLVAALAVAGALAAGTGALAGTAPPTQSPACVRALERLDALEARAAELDTTIAEVEARLASGDLNAKQARKARQRLANLRDRLDNVNQRIDRVEARVASRCDGGPTDPPGELPEVPPVPTE